MDGKIIVKKTLAEKETFRNELSELFKKYDFVLTWESSTEAWLVDMSPKIEVENYE